MRQKRSPWDDRFWMAHPAGDIVNEEPERHTTEGILLGFLIISLCAFVIGYAIGFWMGGM